MGAQELATTFIEKLNQVPCHQEDEENEENDIQIDEEDKGGIARKIGSFTQFREAARKRWAIETLALGNDPFGAVEVVRRLEANQSVALLMDRPPASTSVPVTLFGRPFAASISAAELARATGCVLLPVYLPRTSRGYAAQILPAIQYDRREIATREKRIELTQRIIQTFEPALRLYVNQWFHFVPIWPDPI